MISPNVVATTEKVPLIPVMRPVTSGNGVATMPAEAGTFELVVATPAGGPAPKRRGR